MTARTQKMLMWIGGGALAVVAIAAIAKSATATPPPATPAAVPPGTPVTNLVKGQKYTFAAVLPSPNTDEATLVAQLTSAGWGGVTVFMLGGGLNQPYNGVTVPLGGYGATGTWTRENGPVPTGVVAVTA